MLQAPELLQETFVTKIISVDTRLTEVVQNVPDALATKIPPSQLVFSEGSPNISVINKKSWTKDQATMFLGTLVESDFDTEQLSTSVLQGFTCTSVQKVPKTKIKQLIRACRPRTGRSKVELTEPQLTCMYNLIEEDLDQNFIDYPSDMLLYFRIQDVQESNCRSYFSALGAADFSVASSLLNKGQQLFSEARTCLGITGLSLSRDHLDVLGNMVCTLNSSYIQNSDPSILENLKACTDLSENQVAAMETLLLSGETQYGTVATWNQQTLEDLGILPLYFTINIWSTFTTTIRMQFLKGFVAKLRKENNQKTKLENLFKQISPATPPAEVCTAGSITQVTVSDPAFPFGYDLTQFDLCLDIPALKENLFTICSKVDDNDFQKIILKKLNKAYPSGVSEQQVQLLGSVSRVATHSDISNWNITTIDTLAALMKTEDGTWETAQSKEIITKYLQTSGNSLGSTELNIIGSNVCSLDLSTLTTITANSISDANFLNVATCSAEQKRILYDISSTSFSSYRAHSTDFYNVIKSYLGGAPLSDIVALSTQNISMDINIFRSLDINVITTLTVTNVQGLMGDQLQDLKLFENDTVIQTWVNMQTQSELDTLGVGLINSRTYPTTAQPATDNTATSASGTASPDSTTSPGTDSTPASTMSDVTISAFCAMYSNYSYTVAFLQTEVVSDEMKKMILPCVWKMALSSNVTSEVNLWFDVLLKNYLRFLTRNLISPIEVQSASCQAFQKLVFYMGNNFTYNSTEFGPEDVYNTIRSYLSTGSGARCYNPSDPELNSTSWFFNYIGSFVKFITLNDLTSFISTSQAEVFWEDQANLELFNNSTIAVDVRNYYITQLFTVNPSFSLFKLSGVLLCSTDIPSAVYMSLNEANTMAILDMRNEFCNGIEDPQAFAVLASNIKTITEEIFVTLGGAASGLSNTQITSVPPTVLISSLSTLGSVTTWGQDKANIIIQSITSSGYQINSAAVLESLGTLVVGVPSALLEKIPASELLHASRNPAFVSSMLQAPELLQETFVTKIISVDTRLTEVVQNVPDALATKIPPSQLVFSEGSPNISVINKKSWTKDQATMFLGTLVESDFDTEQLSTSVLQGFTCTSVQKVPKTKIKQLIRACRPRTGRSKVELTEPQLTCMYNLIEEDLDQNFIDYPSDMLLYFRIQDVQESNCRSYFSALGAADFSVASSLLNKGQQLFSEARTCLGITGLSLSRDHLDVLGNMVCTLNSSYIQNSDPSILENLKACTDLSENQVAAMETLLLSGETQYGTVATWNQQTLEDLGILPLYFTINIWSTFTTTIRMQFLKGFVAKLRKENTQKTKLENLFKQISPATPPAEVCTAGSITQVTVSDPAFPFGYDLTQFDLCLDIPALKENLFTICSKVDDNDFQKIILKKLNKAYPSGVSEQQVQLLGSVSRVATHSDISKWNITTIDTLAALMKTEDGTWETAQSKEIITKYLQTSGNSLGSTELNIIGSNVCSLDLSTLTTITANSISDANFLNVATCSAEQKRILYDISSTSFSSYRAHSTDFYNVIKSYLGGAPLSDIVALSTQNISMDINIFRSLDINVITTLTVTNVQGLMGDQLQDLKLFENDTVIQTWVNMQTQSELDTLGVGLINSRTYPTTAQPATDNTATSASGTASPDSTTSPGTDSTPASTMSDVTISAFCAMYSNYSYTVAFLQTEVVSDEMKKMILPCVWKMALSSNVTSEVNLWFDVLLKNYLRFLTRNLISPIEVQSASCQAFQKLVFYMGNNFTYNSTEFGPEDVYNIIRSYLSTGSGARCYNPSDPELNSTSWFFNYIGSFVKFITLNDLTSFISTSQAEVFWEDQANLELFNNSTIAVDVRNYYITQLFTVNPSFSLFKLSGVLLCSTDIPSAVYMSLNEANTMAILDMRNEFCNGIEDPQAFAVLASNIKTITEEIFVTLGGAASGLSNTQITSVPPTVLISSLSTLGSVTTWGQDQANIIIQSITSSGYQINSAAVLESLGTLVVGVPSALLEKIPASELLHASRNPAFVSSMLQAPELLQETFVTKIISVDTRLTEVVQNVPDALATKIPPSQLVFSEGSPNISVINKKSWTKDQATMFLGTLVESDFDTEQLSTSVLQGFTCTSVQKVPKTKIKQLIRACRPRTGRSKVELTEPQLTCMYNLIEEDLDQNFIDYPSDMLLYFRIQDVQESNCRSYFSALGAADFSVASSLLNKGQQLFSEARTCLGITGLSLSRDHLDVLGNMVCTLNSSYIQNSDPSILENLKACTDLSENQVAAMETLLLSGETQYGTVATWNQQTLEDLGILPLYFTINIWSTFTTTIRMQFLKGFVAKLRKENTQKTKLENLFKQISPATPPAEVCTAGSITQVTVSDPAFPFGYDLTQFDLCLDIPALKENLFTICSKVDDNDFQKIILKKLNKAYPSGVSEQQVQLLGSVSRVATHSDISKWNITTIDTLAALMKTEDGTWETAQSKEIITKYLQTSGNSLGSTELNIIGSNVCSLDLSTLTTITANSISDANFLNVATCSAEQKRILYDISSTSFSSYRAHSTDFYNVIKSYLGGAPLSDIVALSTQNISMDINIFRSLDINVITTLTVTNVQGLMGDQLQDLKLFENDTVIQTWVNMQTQSELDTLGVGLINSRTYPTTAQPATDNTATSASGTASPDSTTSPGTDSTPASTMSDVTISAFCAMYSNYSYTVAFLQTEVVSDEMKKMILPCVWKMALSSNVTSEVNLWFDVLLKNYLRFLTRNLISPIEVQSSSCQAFQKLVFYMGNNFTYNSTEFGPEDVYNTIRSYLSTGSGARCYNPSDPELNSTSWFFNYIGSFVKFITLNDLTSFISTSQVCVHIIFNITLLKVYTPTQDKS
ncbi:uncharacterized protein [Nothobranchius furzeri]|uniref:uncharacterized protein n=1 Tax=Nothobranchius furzeri TaxID=105023 RepID=UPI003904CB74